MVRIIYSRPPQYSRMANATTPFASSVIQESRYKAVSFSSAGANRIIDLSVANIGGKFPHTYLITIDLI